MKKEHYTLYLAWKTGKKKYTTEQEVDVNTEEATAGLASSEADEVLKEWKAMDESSDRYDFLVEAEVVQQKQKDVDR